ncbi:hypothetical protein FHETE_7978 [Fusarium heterosporum]|uniref:Uncharacterized protein n=1 Tax=Fusarium heterosporum TaxID=42747 RepID=A0A8H5T3P1_FUSHE|nr:hypothetical protein FHETE_7978 [Fusarium heterosporum]
MSNTQVSGNSAAIVAGAALIAVPALVAGPLLGIVGFGAGGVVAGSAAAGLQSGIGSVVAPSLFATLQSAGAGGYGVAAVHGVIQGVGAIAAAGGIGNWLRGRNGRDEGSDEDNDRDANNEDIHAVEEKED